MTTSKGKRVFDLELIKGCKPDDMVRLVHDQPFIGSSKVDLSTHTRILSLKDAAMTSKKNLIVIQIGCDQRIPANSLGYVSDLANELSTEDFRNDRLRQLSRYVPDLVEEFLRESESV